MRKSSCFIFATTLLGAVSYASAANLTWDSTPGNGTLESGNGTWNASTNNWTVDSGANNVLFTNGDSVNFGPTPATVTVNGALGASGITFANGGTSSNRMVISASGTANTVALSGIIDVGGNNRELQLLATGPTANTFTGSFQKSGAGTLILEGGAGFNLSAITLTAGSLTFNNGAPNLAATTLTLNGGAIGNYGSNPTARTIAAATTIGGNISIGAGTDVGSAAINFTNIVNLTGGTRTLTIGSAGSTISGVISNGTLRLSNSGSNHTVTLSGANTHSGGTTILGDNSGSFSTNSTLRLGNDAALGTGTLTNGTMFNNDVVTIASSSSAARTIANNLTLSTSNASGNTTFGQSSGGTGTMTFTGTVTLSSGGTARNLNTVVDTTFSGVVTGSNTSTVTKIGAAKLTLSGASANTIAVTSGWQINAGSVEANKLSAFGNVTGTNGRVTLGGGDLNTGVSNVNIGALTVSNAASDLTLNGLAAGTLMIAAGQDFTFSAGQWNLDLASNVDVIDSAGGATADFIISGGILDLGGGAIDYGLTYNLLTDFATGSISGLTIQNYDDANWTASLNDSGTLSFATVPEPGAVLLGGLSLLGLLRRRRI
jgi:fibronectin-binding autotransporter adhesin